MQAEESFCGAASTAPSLIQLDQEGQAAVEEALQQHPNLLSMVGEGQQPGADGDGFPMDPLFVGGEGGEVNFI